MGLFEVVLQLPEIVLLKTQTVVGDIQTDGFNPLPGFVKIDVSICLLWFRLPQTDWFFVGEILHDLVDPALDESRVLLRSISYILCRM